MTDEWLPAVAVVVLGSGVVVAIAAITTGWLPPGRGGDRVRRPKLWGYGTLLGMAGMGVFLFLGPLDGPQAGHFPLAAVGMVGFFAGLYVQHRATKSAS